MATLTEINQNLHETNDRLVETNENTQLSAEYLDMTVDTIGSRIENLIEFLRGDGTDQPVISENTTNNITERFSDSITSLRESFANKFDRVIETIGSSNTTLATDRESSGEFDDRSLDILTSLRESFIQKMDELIGFMQGDSLDQLEARREERANQRQLTSSINELLTRQETNVNQNEENLELQEKQLEASQQGDGPGIGGIGIALGTSIGVLVGIVQGYADTFRVILKTIRGIGQLFASVARGIGRVVGPIIGRLSALSKTVSKTVKSLTSAFASIRTTFTSFASNISKIIGSARAIGVASVNSAVFRIRSVITGLGSSLSRVASSIRGVGTFVSKFFQPIIKSFRAAFALLAKPLGIIRKFMSTIGARMGIIGTIVKSVAGVARTIFLPLNIMFVGFQTIKGLLDGFAEGGIFGAIEGALKGLVNALVGMPLDLLKDGVAFILGIFGFENAKSLLQSFSFQDLIGDLISAPFDIIKSAVGYFKDKLGFSGEQAPGIGELLLNIITIPHELLKDAVAWFAGLLGFDKAKNALASFSVSGFIMDLISAPFDIIKGAVSWFKDKLGFSGEQAPSVGQILTNIIALPYELIKDAVAWFTGLFGFDKVSENLENFSVGGFILDLINAPFKALGSAVNWFAGLFNFENITDRLKSLDVTQMLTDIVNAPFRILSDIKDWILEKVSNVGSIVADLIPEGVKKFFGGVGDFFTGGGDDDNEGTNATEGGQQEPTRTRADIQTDIAVARQAISGAREGSIEQKRAKERLVELRKELKETGSATATTTVEKPSEPGSSLTSGAQLEVAGKQRSTMMAEQAAASGSASDGSMNLVNSTSNNINYSTATVYRQNPSPVRQPNSAKDIFYSFN